MSGQGSSTGTIAVTVSVAAGVPVLWVLASVLGLGPIAFVVLLVGLTTGLVFVGASIGQWRACLLPGAWILAAAIADVLAVSGVVQRPQDDWIPQLVGAVVWLPLGALLLGTGVSIRKLRDRQQAQDAVAAQ